jgi:hypothetical protein
MKRYPPLAATLFIGFAIPVAQAQDTCAPIQFARGQSSATVKGVAPLGAPFACFTFVAGRGQTATIRLTHSNGNTAFNVDGVVDNQDKYSFRAEARTYKIDVYQITRELATRNAQFAMQVTVR